MTAERFRQIRHVFEAALEREPEPRAAFLAEACQGDEKLRIEVEQLLRARDQGSLWLDAETATPGGRLEGQRIGRYEILRSLGEGGMGAVYLAARADGAFRKLVALKIVRPESTTNEVLRRFQQEREILASLEHPNIARILDGGETADGLPYLVMEYVDGKPIDVYCDEKRLNVRERLVLFDAVCSAVRYAHTKQIVHRDLKPSNVLVTATGEAKLLDFGIAKLLASHEGMTLLRTRSDLRLMTPEYASPEQVRGEKVTTLSDIYSPGVLLYELLTGRRPYSLPSRIISEVIRVICEEPPTRPSTVVTQQSDAGGDHAPERLSRIRGVSPKQLRRELAGNLDGILLKTLEKDPRPRYRSVADLSEDLHNHLKGERVRARKPSLAVFAQRHRWWMLAIIAFALFWWNGWISNTAAFMVASIAIFLPLSFWWASHIYGASFVPRAIVEMKLKEIGVVGLIWLASYSLLKAFFGLDYLGTASVLTVATAGWMLYILLRWSMRRKLLGPVLLDASRPRKPYLALIILGVLALAMKGGLLRSDYTAYLSLRSQPFVYFHLPKWPPGTVHSGYGDTSFPITAYAMLSEQHDVFTNVIAFAPLSNAPQERVPIRFGSQEGAARGD